MTTPTGRLVWGQAGVYDAIDDRAVIAAVTGYRTGLVRPVEVTAGAGLNVVIAGGWLGVADCGDRTSAVVGSLIEAVVQAIPGPPTGERVDYVWCDVEPDEGQWSLAVIPAAEAAGRPGIPLASITVPANASTAAQMDIRSADVGLERRLLAVAEFTETNVRTGQTWDTVATCATCTATCEPGHWYRVRFTANSTQALTSQFRPPSGRIGLGMRPAGGPDAASQLQRAGVICWPTEAGAISAMLAEVEFIFRHPLASAPIARSFDGRIWIAGTGSFRTCAVTSQGPGLVISVEDLGT